MTCGPDSPASHLIGFQLMTMPVENTMADVNVTPLTQMAPPRLRILVVDDNHDSALSLAMMLSIMGHETRTAHDGESAVSTAENFLPDVVLLDIGLPKLNGYEVAQKIRAAEWGGSMFLIAVTGWGQDEDGRYLIAFFIHKQDGRALIISARNMDKAEKKRYGRK